MKGKRMRTKSKLITEYEFETEDLDSMRRACMPGFRTRHERIDQGKKVSPDEVMFLFFDMEAYHAKMSVELEEMRFGVHPVSIPGVSEETSRQLFDVNAAKALVAEKTRHRNRINEAIEHLAPYVYRLQEDDVDDARFRWGRNRAKKNED